jgi:cystathionine beta-lyase/cystathionine gamma-synthase
MGDSLKFETLVIHAGQKADPLTGAVMTPIYQTSTYLQKGVGKHTGYEYSRTGNPTRTALESCLAALEAGSRGLAFASGMAAIDAVMHLLEPGDQILAVNDLYGGTYRLFEKVYRPLGLNFEYAPGDELDGLRSRINSQTRMVWLETPTNPLLRLYDIEAIASAAHQANPQAIVVVDNTFATPYLQQPLKLGADIVIHSTTKYLGGHSDVIGGAVITKDDQIGEQLAFLQNAIGAVPGPMDCFLVLRGIKTLPVRMDRHAENAFRLAEFLAKRTEIDLVIYPTLSDHPQRELAEKQMRNGGGMISFTLKDGEAAAKAVVEATRIFSLAESLGGVESLIELPAAMTHASTQGSSLEVDPGLVRLSVGLEAYNDLENDLAQSLAQIA